MCDIAICWWKLWFIKAKKLQFQNSLIAPLTCKGTILNSRWNISLSIVYLVYQVFTFLNSVNLFSSSGIFYKQMT